MYIFKSFYKTLIADIITPVEIYLKLRDLFPGALLLENFNIKRDDFSIICLDAVAEIIIDNNYIYYRYPDKCEEKISLIEKTKNGCEFLENFMKQFYSDNKYFKYSGFYGYITYDSLPYFENISLQAPTHNSYKTPQIRFALYKYLIYFNNFKNILNIYSHSFSKEENSSILKIIYLIFNNKYLINNFPFITIKKISSNLSDYEYKKLVSKSIKACKLGYVFQIVISRQYQQKFKGDEFYIYRALRYINPSPHLFYFDYGDYKIFGSSPEDQLTIKNRIAYIYPIAGTILRLRNKHKEKIISESLVKNTKEHSEHVMLVDLARNDLSRTSSEVKVERFKYIKSFSHVLHLESKVSGKLPIYYSPIKIFIESFPAGTLSGAPKYKAIELIDEFENQSRGIYGGAIGFFGLDGHINTAIIIRTFLSKGNTLFMQAGAGIITNSTEENELQEVNNKLKALNKSITIAKNFL